MEALHIMYRGFTEPDNGAGQYFCSSRYIGGVTRNSIEIYYQKTYLLDKRNTVHTSASFFKTV